jgi:hypothetical protein
MLQNVYLKNKIERDLKNYKIANQALQLNAKTRGN